MKNMNINFMGQRFVAMTISLLLVAASVSLLATKGLTLGIDFTGGTVIEVQYPQATNLEEVRSTLAEAGFDDAEAQFFGSASVVQIRLPNPDSAKERALLSNEVLTALRAKSAAVEMLRVEFVGPKIGEELREDGGLATVYALIAILIYIALRFQIKFTPGPIIALVHDVVLVLGFFSLTQIEFDLTVLAAILAVIGYSLNDTIVVYDRIRENFLKLRKEVPNNVVNISVNQTLARTLVTSLTTMLVLVALYLVGGEVIGSFALALIVGVVVGTYSSIYVASSALLMLGVTKEDLIVQEKENPEDQLP